MEQSWNDYYVNNDEIISLINEYRDEHISKIQKIILDKLSFFIYAKIKVYRKEYFYQDLFQEGMIGLLKAIENFDQTKGNNFFLVASWYISNSINKFLKQIHKQKKEIACENITQFIKDVNLTPYEYYDKQEEEIILQKALRKLPNVYKKILVMRFGIFETEKYTLQQIGEAFSVSKQYVEQIEKKALIKLSQDREVQKYFL